MSFGVFRTFRSVIRHSTLRGVWKLVAAVLLKDSLLYLFVSLLLGDGILPPKTAAAGFLLDGLLTLFLLLAVRLTMLSSMTLCSGGPMAAAMRFGRLFTAPATRRSPSRCACSIRPTTVLRAF